MQGDILVLNGNPDQGGYIVCPQFVKQAFPVRIDRVDGHPQLYSNVMICFAGDDLDKGLMLAGSQWLLVRMSIHGLKSTTLFLNRVFPKMVVPALVN